MLKLASSIALIFLSGIIYAQSEIASLHYEGTNEREVRVEGIFCDVVVHHGDKLIFDGLITGSGKAGDYKIETIKEGNSIIFKVSRQSKLSNTWNNVDKAELNLQVPTGTSLTVSNSSGNIRINDLEFDKLILETTSGDMKLNKIKSDVVATSTSGNITINSLVGDLSSRSTSGDQTFESVQGNIQSQTTSGNQEFNRVVGAIKTKATSGDLTFAELKGAMRAVTTSGNIIGRDLMLTADCDLETTSGDITINLENELTQIGFDLRASSGNLRVGNIKGDDELLIRRGNYQIKGVTTSGNQKYDN